jgi:hypothetical protein
LKAAGAFARAAILLEQFALSRMLQYTRLLRDEVTLISWRLTHFGATTIILGYISNFTTTRLISTYFFERNTLWLICMFLYEFIFAAIADTWWYYIEQLPILLTLSGWKPFISQPKTKGAPPSLRQHLFAYIKISPRNEAPYRAAWLYAKTAAKMPKLGR